MDVVTIAAFSVPVVAALTTAFLLWKERGKRAWAESELSVSKQNAKTFEGSTKLWKGVAVVQDQALRKQKAMISELEKHLSVDTQFGRLFGSAKKREPGGGGPN